MTIAIIIIVVSLSNIICLFIGAKIGQKTAKGKDIKICDNHNSSESI
nr:MAG TPA: hypothetical protein [Caudoviricetes sp.]